MMVGFHPVADITRCVGIANPSAFDQNDASFEILEVGRPALINVLRRDEIVVAPRKAGVAQDPCSLKLQPVRKGAEVMSRRFFPSVV